MHEPCQLEFKLLPQYDPPAQPSQDETPAALGAEGRVRGRLKAMIACSRIRSISL